MVEITQTGLRASNKQIQFASLFCLVVFGFFRPKNVGSWCLLVSRAFLGVFFLEQHVGLKGSHRDHAL